MILSLKRMVLLSIFFVILGVAAIWGLEAGTLTKAPGTPETEGAGIMVEASRFPLKLTMILNKTTFEVEEPVNMTFYLENIGNETLTMVFSDGHDRFSFNVLDENDSLIYESHWFYPTVYIPMDVPPRLARITTQTWWQKTNIGDGTQQVKLGKYKIVGLFISGTFDFTIETPPITIRITA